MIITIFLWIATLIYVGFALNVLIAQVTSILANEKMLWPKAKEGPKHTKITKDGL